MQNKEKKEQNSTKSKKSQSNKNTSKKVMQSNSQKSKEQSDVIVAKPGFLRVVITSVAFWTFLLIVFFVLIGFNIFGRSSNPDEAKSSIQISQEIRYGTSSQIELELDKKVAFEKGDVVWVVDGVEVQRGSSKQNKSFVLKHNFDSVGTHKVRAEVEGYPNLTCETDVQVQKPLLVIQVEDQTKTYGQENPVAKYSISGFVDNDTMESLKLQTPQFDATKESPVGEYGIKQISHEKYDVVAKGGKLEVTKKLLQVVANGGIKIYDGSTQVDDLSFVVSGKIGEDDVYVDVESASYVDKNVGKNKGIKIKKATLQGADAKNYCLPKDPVASGQIVAKNISLQEVDVADKYYDGCTSVTFDNLGHFEGVAKGDDVNIGQIVARFETPSAGKQKRVLVDKILLVGQDAKNYVIELPQNLCADINGEIY